jgi:prepilin-type N-terminal cleavage/methylation domain-containing protein
LNTTNKKSRTAGFTFIELLIASLVFTLAVAGLLQSVFGTLYLLAFPYFNFVPHSPQKRTL